MRPRPARSQTTCQFLCFKLCSEQPIQIDPTQLPNLKLSKLSLKRVLQQHSNDLHSYGRLPKSISDKNLNKIKTETTRSQNQVKEMALFKKKAILEQEIERVDEQMGRLTLKYEQSINQLRAIKKQLQAVRHT